MRSLAELGYTVKMTSNGQFEPHVLRALHSEGLAGVNFSVHSLHPDRLAKLQRPQRSIEWGRAAIQCVIDNAHKALALGLRVKLNAVVGSDPTDALELINFAHREQLPLRLLNDLGLGSIATDTIESVISALGGRIERIGLTEGLSTYSYDIAADGGIRFGVKAITKSTLSALCSDCGMRDLCQEWFYGIRIERQHDRLWVRLCLHRQDSQALQLSDDFFRSPQYLEIRSLVE